MPLVLKASATRKIYYSINPKVSVRAILKHPEIEFFANSSGIRSEIERKYGVSAFPAYGGINLQMFHYRQPEQKEGGEPIVVMVFGRLSKPKKGTIKVVKACEKLYKSGVNIKLLLFDSPTDTKAERAIKRFNTIVPHSFFLNHPVERNEELFHRADIFVSAETSGGWSNTSAEAMASGVPVIATSVGTIDFVLHKETGLVLKKANKYHIRKAIKLLIDDYVLRKKFSLAGRKRIENFDWLLLSRAIVSKISSEV